MLDYHFEVTSIEDMITAAGIIEDDGKAYITGTRLKELVPMIVGIRDDIEKCPAICTELGVPDYGGGTHGLVKRLECLAAGITPGSDF